MADLIQNQSLTARAVAQKNLEDAFKTEALDLLYVLSIEIKSYLIDYFTLINDMKIELKEEERRSYSDYCFIVAPVHKAFERYLISFLSLFRLKISYRGNETVGHYLNITDQEKRKNIQTLKTNFAYVKVINENKWIDVWNSFKQEWFDNRNSLSHPNGEKIPTLRQAEQAANSIIRQMDISSQLLVNEFYRPLIEYVEKMRTQKKIEENKANS